MLNIIEMKNKVLLFTGLLLGLISAYPPFGWIYVLNSYSEATRPEIRSVFYQKILFGLNTDYSLLFHTVVILLGLFSVSIFAVLLYKLSQTNTDNKTTFFILYLILLIIFSLVSVLNLGHAN